MKAKRTSLVSLVLLLSLTFSSMANAQTIRVPRASAPFQPVQNVARIVDNHQAVDLSQAIKTADGRVRVIVELEEPPLSLYRGGVAGLNATNPAATGAVKLDANSPASRAYVNYLTARQDKLVAQVTRALPATTVDYRYQVAFNGFAAAIDPADVNALAKMSGVKNVYPDLERNASMDASLDLINAPAFWAELGGKSQAGKGMKVAIVDSGIRPENPLFSASGFAYPAGFPLDDDYCAAHPAAFCNGKIIVARYYTPTLAIHTLEVMSPLDIHGHGTHVAGTSAGNQTDVLPGNVVPVTTTISGVAPAAYLMVYKGLFLKADGTNASGSDAMLVAALNDALSDGADVVNNSWGGGGGGDPHGTVYDVLIPSLNAGGLVVVFAAGNSGTARGTVECPACVEETIAVAASTTNRIFANAFDVTGPLPVPDGLKGLAAVPGSGPAITTDITGTITYAGSVNPANALGCTAFTGTPFQNKIALIRRGNCDFSVKVNNARNAGAKAVVVVSQVGGPPTVMGSLESTTIPGVMLDRVDGQAVIDWAVANPTATVQIHADTAKIIRDRYQNILAGFSSVGPNGDSNVLKPDITAPGVNILSGFSPAHSGGLNFNIIGGTSMAAPHVTGAVALLLQQHPTWNPLQVKSALMSTSIQTITKANGLAPADAFDIGAGRIDLDRARQAALTFDKASFANNNCVVSCDWTDALKNVSGKTATWVANVEAPDGMEISVAPGTITLGANQSLPFLVHVDVSQLPQDDWYFGAVKFHDTLGQYPDAYLPIAVYASPNTDGLTLAQQVDQDTVQANATLNYTVTVTNNTAFTSTFVLQNPVPENADYISGTATSGMTYVPGDDTLVAEATLAPMSIDVSQLPDTGGYYEIKGFGVDLCKNPAIASGDCDEQSVNLNLTLPFYYMGMPYNQVGVSSDGFLVAGGTDGAGMLPNRLLPSPQAPNNIIAPLWTDLDMIGTDSGDPGSGGMYFATLVDPSNNRYLVVEWYQAAQFGETITYTFQAWIQLQTGNIWFVYEDLPAEIGDFGTSVGAEDSLGNLGSTYYYVNPNNTASVTGQPPLVGHDLVITSQAGGSQTYTYSLKPAAPDQATILNTVTAVNQRNGARYEAFTTTLVEWLKLYLPYLGK